MILLEERSASWGRRIHGRLQLKCRLPGCAVAISTEARLPVKEDRYYSLVAFFCGRWRNERLLEPILRYSLLNHKTIGVR